MSDWQLLQDFWRQDSETAFAALVKRYARLVYWAAFRQTNDRALAEDITQAVFTLLARKASSLTEKTILAGWLFRTTRHVAQTAIRSEQRRRRRELEAARMNFHQTEAEIWDEMAPVLDETLAQLAETDRNALLLRFFQQKSLSEVGQILGVSEEAAKKRSARAVEKLRHLFVQRGFILSGAALAGLLSTNAVLGIPAALVARISGAGVLKRSSLALSVLLLVRESLRRSAIAKAKLTLGLAGAIALVTLVGTIAWQRFRAMPAVPKTVAAVVAAANNQPTQSTAKVSDPTPFPTTIPLRVIAAEDGRVLARVPVHVDYSGREHMSIELITDREGRCKIPLAGRRFRDVDARVNAVGYVPRDVGWFRYELESQVQIEEHVLRLDRGQHVNGLVRDESGQAVPRARLTFFGGPFDASERERIGSRYAESDLEGVWTSDQVPSGVDSLGVLVEHPDFAPLRTNCNFTVTGATEPVLVLRPGVSVAGYVVSESGLSVPDASVFDQADSFVPSTTDSAGQFYLAHVNPGTVRLVAQADGYVAVAEDIDCSKDVDTARLILGMPLSSSGQSVKAEPEERVIQINGKVIDDNTEQPVDRFTVLLGPTVITEMSPVPRSSSFGSGHQFLGEPRGGAFAWNFPPPVAPPGQFKLEIRAEGYQPAISGYIPVNDESQELQFRLKKRGRVSGQVWTPDGKIATNAIVQLAGKDFLPTIQARPNQPLGLVMYTTRGAETQSSTDREGKFSLRPAAGMDRLILLHESGCCVLSLTELAKRPITLQRWGRIEGDVRIGALAGTNQSVQIDACRANRGELFIPYEGRSRTDDKGRFVFEHVPPGTYRVFRVMGLGGSTSRGYVMSYNTGVEAKPGEVIHVTVGGSGRKVIGQIRTTPENGVTDWNSDFQALIGQGLGTPAQQTGQALDAFCLLSNYYLQIVADGTFVVDDVPPGKYRLNIRLTGPVEPPPVANPEPNPNPQIPIFVMEDPATRILRERREHPRRQIGALTLEVMIPEAADQEKNDPVDLGVFTIELTK